MRKEICQPLHHVKLAQLHIMTRRDKVSEQNEDRLAGYKSGERGERVVAVLAGHQITELTLT
jgi:hypothetical protein